MAGMLGDVGPFRVRIYDKAFTFLFQLSDAAVSVTPRHLAKGTGTITVPLGHPRADALLQPGVRATVDYLVGDTPADDASWHRVISGPLWTVNIADAEAPAAAKSVAFGVEDDLRVLAGMLSWPVPGAAITAQTSANYTATGNAETVIKNLVTANATRLGLPLTAATNLGRGATVKADTRFKVTLDDVLELATAGGVGVTIKQAGTGLVLDVYVPTDRTSRVLSESSGAITSWSLNRSGPAVTRAVVASQGEGTAREFSVVTSATTETAWGAKLETFVDARDTADATVLAQRGQQAITEGAAQAGYSITIAETAVVRAFHNLFPGDLVAVQITPTLALDDIVSELTVSWSVEDGLSVTPQVGSPDSTTGPFAVLATAISRTARKIRHLGSSL